MPTALIEPIIRERVGFPRKRKQLNCAVFEFGAFSFDSARSRANYLRHFYRSDFSHPPRATLIIAVRDVGKIDYVPEIDTLLISVVTRLIFM